MEEGSVVAGEGPTAYLLTLFFRWDFSDPFDVCLGYPVLRYPTPSLLILDIFLCLASFILKPSIVPFLHQNLWNLCFDFHLSKGKVALVSSPFVIHPKKGLECTFCYMKLTQREVLVAKLYMWQHFTIVPLRKYNPFE